jgi:hypothetical protein
VDTDLRVTKVGREGVRETGATTGAEAAVGVGVGTGLVIADIERLLVLLLSAGAGVGVGAAGAVTAPTLRRDEDAADRGVGTEGAGADTEALLDVLINVAPLFLLPISESFGASEEEVVVCVGVAT